MIEIIFLAGGLAMDAFSVCVGFGVCNPKAKVTSAFRLSFFTGLFQFFMPLLGWFIGKLIGTYFFKYSCWIAFGILFAIGAKMIIEALEKKEDCPVADISRGKHLFFVSFATSIDALAAGLTLGILKMPLLSSAAIIGGITFILCICGVYLGKIAGFILGKWAEVAGGFILIGIGFRILLQNLIK